MNPNFRRGKLHYDGGRYELAEPEFRRALADDPELTDAHGLLAWSLYRLGRPDEAIAAADEALRLNPNWIDIHCLLGCLLRDTGDHTAAVATFVEAVRLDPDHITARRLLAGEQHDLGYSDVALTTIDAALALAPSDTECLITKAAILIGAGDSQTAEGLLRQVLAVAPDAARAHEIFGRLWEARGKQNQAARSFRAALRADPGNRQVRRWLQEFELERIKFLSQEIMLGWAVVTAFAFILFCAFRLKDVSSLLTVGGGIAILLSGIAGMLVALEVCLPRWTACSLFRVGPTVPAFESVLTDSQRRSARLEIVTGVVLAALLFMILWILFFLVGPTERQPRQAGRSTAESLVADFTTRSHGRD